MILITCASTELSPEEGSVPGQDPQKWGSGEGVVSKTIINEK